MIIAFKNSFMTPNRLEPENLSLLSHKFNFAHQSEVG